MNKNLTSKPIDLSESAAGEEDPGADIELQNKGNAAKDVAKRNPVLHDAKGPSGDAPDHPPVSIGQS